MDSYMCLRRYPLSKNVRSREHLEKQTVLEMLLKRVFCFKKITTFSLFNVPQVLNQIHTFLPGLFFIKIFFVRINSDI